MLVLRYLERPPGCSGKSCFRLTGRLLESKAAKQLIPDRMADRFASNHAVLLNTAGGSAPPANSCRVELDRVAFACHTEAPSPASPSHASSNPHEQLILALLHQYWLSKKTSPTHCEHPLANPSSTLQSATSSPPSPLNPL